MKKRQTSYAFLMEMLWVCGFFALAACIFVLTFVKADHLSKRAENLNHAVLIAQNAVESCFSEYGKADGNGGNIEGRSSGVNGTDGADNIGSANNIGDIGSISRAEEAYFDRSWAPAASADEAAFILSVSTREEDGLLLVTAVVTDSGKETIYQLDGSRSLGLMEGGSHEKQN